MSYSNDWDTTNPIDHLKFKDMPGKVRDIRTDLEERLATVLYGFLSGELSSHIGLKKGRFITIGSAAPTTPPGTGDAASVDIYARSNGTDPGVKLYTMGGDGTEVQLILTGEIKMYGGASAPSGWLLCDGAAISRDTYAALFAVISTRYGIGDNSTTFNVPNFVEKVPRGVSSVPGTGDGADQATLITANLAAHSHTFQHASSDSTGNNLVVGSLNNLNLINQSTAETGSGTPFDIIPANTQALFIIKT